MTFNQAITKIVTNSRIVISRNPDRGTSIRGQGLGILVVAILLTALLL